MTTNPPLAGSHLRTYNAIFQHPISHNLEWRAVRSLLARMGEVVEEPNGNLRVMRNGHAIVLRPPRSKDVSDADEIMVLRHFIEGSEAAPAEPGEGQPRWLVVIDHHEASIYRSEGEAALPEQILPHEPEAFFRHAHNSKDFTRGKEKPDPNSFFEPVARALKGAGQILVFGSGTGTGSEMEQFVAWLGIHHKELSKRVVGTQVIDEHHLTKRQLLAKARESFAAVPAA